MAATEITAATRFFNVGTTKIYFVTTMSNYLSPSRAELNAGTDLTPEVAAIEGWSVESGEIDTPDFKNRFTAKIAGRIEAEDSSITMYATPNGVDSRAIMPRDQTGYIVWFDGGDVAGYKMDVYPVTVRAVSRQRASEGEAARSQHQFSITRVPAENVAVPA
jgi:hypothetical protein